MSLSIVLISFSILLFMSYCLIANSHNWTKREELDAHNELMKHLKK